MQVTNLEIKESSVELQELQEGDGFVSVDALTTPMLRGEQDGDVTVSAILTGAVEAWPGDKMVREITSLTVEESG